MLVSNVENLLSADEAKLNQSEIQPKDLLIKSNPGVFADMHPDITNPRDMYSYLSKRKLPKLVDDISFTRQKTIYDDKLSRSNSFKDISKTSNAKMAKKYHFHSQQDLTLSEKKDPSYVALNSNAPYITPEDMAKFPEKERTMMTNFNLPSLNENGINNGKEEDNDGTNDPVSFPVIQSSATEKDANKGQKVKTSKSLEGRTRSNVTFSNKIDKWFAEMPSDVTDKADRAVMVDMIREHMATYQNGNRLDERLSKMKRRNTNLKSLNSIQHQFLELRAETAPKPKREGSNINSFKQKQKTSLSFKSDLNENDRNHRLMVYDTEKKYEEQFLIEQDENKPTIGQLARSNTQNFNGLKKINLDKFAYDAYTLNPNQRFNFAQPDNVQHSRFMEEIHADTLRRKSDREHWFKMNQTKTYPSIVNISMEKVKREQARSNQLRRSLSVLKMESYKDNVVQERPCETKHNNSASSSLSGKKEKHPSKAALSKFHTLDVFGGVKTLPNDTHFSDCENYNNPLVKLDLRRSRTHHAMKTHNHELPVGNAHALQKKPHELATVDFRFGSGEVIIRRKAACKVEADTEQTDLSPEIVALKSPNAPPNNTEYSGRTDEISAGDPDIKDPFEDVAEPITLLGSNEQKTNAETDNNKAGEDIENKYNSNDSKPQINETIENSESAQNGVTLTSN